MSSRRRVWILAGTGALVAVVVAGLGMTFFLKPAPSDRQTATVPPDPRLSYTGPYRNVNPAVHYVPEALCSECHADIAADLARHPMGRTILPIALAARPPEDVRHQDPFEALGEQFRIVRDGSHVRHLRARLGPNHQPAAEQAWDVRFAIGSGAKGYSYLSDHEGYLFQTPISWYAQRQTWGLSPGFGAQALAGRPVVAECLFCHANRAHYVEGSRNHYREPIIDGHGIGCQRCHGPGELHVAAPGADTGPDGIDPSIVNPRHLTPALRDAVCEQCHLEGEARTVRHGRHLDDYRPGLPLEWFWAVLVRAPGAGEGRRAVGHVEQMVQSRCYVASNGQLGCISCHDPHRVVPPEKRASYYRARCLQCHEKHGCSLPEPERLRQSANDSCIACHMPRYGSSDIPHTASTDHRIPRVPERGRRGVSPEPAAALASFYRGRPGVDDAEDDRDEAVALVKLALAGSAPRGLGRALPALDAAVRRDPGDVPAAEARAYALGLHGRWAESLAAFRVVLTLSPDREPALTGAAVAAESAGHIEEALADWRRAIAANPWAPDYRRALARLLNKQEAWAEALPQCEAWVRLDPLSAEARAARVAWLLGTGRTAEARVEFARVEALAPANLTELRIRFEEKFKGASPPG